MGDARHFLVHRDTTPRGTPDFFRHTPDLQCHPTICHSEAPSHWQTIAQNEAALDLRHGAGSRRVATSLRLGPDDTTARDMADIKDSKAEGAEKPEILNVNHQDSIFGNAFGSRSYYTVHPEWVSESGSNPQPDPLHRPPWPWEQPRYRVNMQVPITYETPDAGIPTVDEKKELEKEEDRFCQEELPPISYQLSQMYKTTHPAYVLRH